MMLNTNLLTQIDATELLNFLEDTDGTLGGIWTLMSFLGGFLIVIAIVMAGIGFMQQAAQGGRGGGGGNQQLKTLGKMIVFGVLMAGPATWLPTVIGLVVGILNIVLNVIGGAVDQLNGTP